MYDAKTVLVMIEEPTSLPSRDAHTHQFLD